jgi:hypothetical protein
MRRQQPREIVRPRGCGDGVLPGKGRVPDECVETGVRTCEDLGKLDLPVKGRHRPVPFAQRLLYSHQLEPYR